MKQIGIFLFTLLAATTTVKAQSNYKPAKLITTQGDTLTGFINYKEWEMSPKVIEFKKAMEDKSKPYTPSMLRKFSITDIVEYETYRGSLSMNKNVFPNLDYTLDSASRNDTVFLQAIYKGRPLSLYKYQDELKPRFFVRENDMHPVELKSYEYYTDGNNFRSVHVFANQLEALALKYNPGNRSIHQDLVNMRFSDNDIINVLKAINNDKTKKTAGVAGGRFFAGILFSRTVTEFGEGSIFHDQPYSSYIPRISAGADLFLNKYVQKLFFRAELSFTAITPQFEVKNRDYVESIKQKYAHYTISFAPQLIYNIYNKEAIKVYLGAGPAFNYSIYANNEIITTTTYNVVYTKTYDDFQTTWINFPMVAGITLQKKLNIYALYSLPMAYNKNYNSYTLSNTTYGLGVHYLFK